MSAWTHGRRRYVGGRWGQVHLREWGEGVPVILLHQTPWSSVQFHRVGPLLADAGFRVIAPDTPGYGLSDAPPAQPIIEDYADNLAQVLSDLGVGRTIVGGHHTGALIAASLAARRSDLVERLILDNPPFYNEEERSQRQSLPHLTHRPVAGGGHYVERWAFLRRLADPAMTVETLNLAITAFQVNASEADFGHAAAYAWAMAPVLQVIVAPTLVLSNLNDPIHSHGARLIEARPDWNRTIISGGSANVLERPSLWTDAVRAFVDHTSSRQLIQCFGDAPPRHSINEAKTS